MPSRPFTLLCALLLAAACLPSAGAAAEPAPLPTPLPAPIVETIAGRRLETLTIRHPASPVTLVFEAGSRGTIEKWGRVLAGASRDATVFAYNRPGYGNSEATETPRDGRTVVEELRQLLRQKGLPPPYLLVGHSLGGLYMQLFARAHPDEVSGLVLVDTTYPRAIKPPRDFPWAVRMAARLAFSRTAWREIERIDETGEQVLALPAIDAMPIVRLINAPKAKPGEMPPIPLDLGVFRQDRATIARIQRMYPHAKNVIVDSDHQMPLASPDVVLEAIHELVNELSAARSASR